MRASNTTLERTAGSHSLAAAAQRERWAESVRVAAALIRRAGPVFSKTMVQRRKAIEKGAFSLLTVVAALLMFSAPSAVQSQGTRVPRIGALLMVHPERFQAGFRDGLRDLGYVEGESILVEYRSAAGQADRLSDLAADLIRLKVDVIVAQGTPSVQAAKRGTTEIRIVMAPAGDPVGTGLIASLARPSGNVTGVSATAAELGGKLVELIRELRPAATRVAVLLHSTDPFAKPFLNQIQSAADTLGVRVQ